jgi:predicted Zn-dependent protease
MKRYTTRRSSRAVLSPSSIGLFILAVLLAACQTNPATGTRQLNLISTEQEIRIGIESDRQITASMGLYENEPLSAYVEQLGQRLAASSERPDLPWAFKVIDDSTVNAFALPGGFIYVTRGILAHLGSEAELAGVLGHEIGHVTAQHSVNQLSKQQLSMLGLGVAMIIVPGLQDFAPIASIGLQLMFLKFSRDDELQADELGVRYMTNISENPGELVNVMETLERVSLASGGGRLPEWLSTHPDPGNRRDRLADRIATLGAGEYSDPEREKYFSMIDGIVYGPNPVEGFTSDGVFYHPGLRFRIDFPESWQVINQKQAVIALSPNQDAVIQLSVSGASSPAEALSSLYAEESLEVTGGRTTRINGLAAASADFTTQTEQGVIAGRAVFIEYGELVYQLLGYSTDRGWIEFAGPVSGSMFSFMELTERRFLEVEPLRLEVIRVPEEMSLAEFHDRYPSPAVTLEDIALINHLEPGSHIAAGTLVKRVVGEPFDD